MIIVLVPFAGISPQPSDVILKFGTPGERASGSFSVENGRQPRGSEAESEGFRVERSPRRSDNCALLIVNLASLCDATVSPPADVISAAGVLLLMNASGENFLPKIQSIC